MSHHDKCHTMTFKKKGQIPEISLFCLWKWFYHSKDNNKLKTILIKYHGM